MIRLWRPWADVGGGGGGPAGVVGGLCRWGGDTRPAGVSRPSKILAPRSGLKPSSMAFLVAPWEEGEEGRGVNCLLKDKREKMEDDKIGERNND